MSPETLLVRNLRCAFPNFEIEASFQARPEERVAIFSPSGTGKSTLLRILAGLDVGAPVTGEIRMGERNLIAEPPEARNIGVVFQEGYLFPQMTAVENVAYPLKLRGVPKTERLKLAEEWLKKLSLENRVNHTPQELSGGERQRVAFARALVFRPRMILLDEAFSALDLHLREKLSTLLQETHADLQVPILFVTHDQGERDRLATRVLKFAHEEGRSKFSFTD